MLQFSGQGEYGCEAKVLGGQRLVNGSGAKVTIQNLCGVVPLYLVYVGLRMRFGSSTSSRRKFMVRWPWNGDRNGGRA